MKKNIAIFISGRGSNMEALISSSKKDSSPAVVSLVISDKQDALGIKKAQENNIKTIIIPKSKHETKSDHEKKILEVLDENPIDFIFLAGYMRILSSEFCKKWKDKIINIHPSLLPSFKGLDTHKRVLDAGVKFTGCTIHYVTEKMDEGKIIAQAALIISPNEREKSLKQRVLQLEHRLYPQIMYDICLDKDSNPSFFVS